VSSFEELLANNQDLADLVRDRYAVGFDSHCLIVRDVPYLDAEGTLKIGAIITKMVPRGNHRVEQENHQVFFAGGLPHDRGGQPLKLRNRENQNVQLSDAAADVKVERAFSAKPTEAGYYDNFYHKIETYVTIISGPARSKYPGATPFTSRLVKDVDEDSVFIPQNAMMMLAGINDLTKCFSNEVVGVIGLGGTGAYVLDFLAKTHVKEVRGWDGDRMLEHNIFRSPGRHEECEFGTPKADVYRARYKNLRHRIVLENININEATADRLDGLTFAFVCVDSGGARTEIFDLLIARSIPFIDVGMGLVRHKKALEGHVRATFFPADRVEEIRARNLVPEGEAENDEYRDHIQIGELNALNACLAVIRYKQYLGFYLEEEAHDNILFGVEDLRTYFRKNPDAGDEDGED
jgi:molybdopterin/thiamine biosynthesis adenylyltransferase